MRANIDQLLALPQQERSDYGATLKQETIDKLKHNIKEVNDKNALLHPIRQRIVEWAPPPTYKDLRDRMLKRLDEERSTTDLLELWLGQIEQITPLDMFNRDVASLTDLMNHHVRSAAAWAKEEQEYVAAEAALKLQFGIK